MTVSLQHHELKEDLENAARELGVILAIDEVRDPIDEGHSVRKRVITARLPRACGVRARFVREGLLERAKKVFVDELEVGSSWFDDSIYVSTETRDVTARALENKRAQQALILLVDESRNVEVEPELIRVSDDDVHDDGRDALAEILALAACLLGP